MGATGGRDDIVVIDQWLSRAEFVKLLARSAGLINLHRAECFGLPIFEALALGIPVVTTGFGGPVDLLDDSTSFLVRATPSPVPDGTPPYPPGAIWGEPDLDHAAALLRQVVANPHDARNRAERGRQLVRRELSPEAVGARLQPRIQHLLSPPKPGAGGKNGWPKALSGWRAPRSDG